MANPAAPGVSLLTDSGRSSSDGITNVGTLVVSGVDPGATVQYSIDGGSTWTGSFTAVEGANSVAVRQTDASNNASAATTFSFTLDTHAPAQIGANPLDQVFLTAAGGGTVTFAEPALIGDQLIGFRLTDLSASGSLVSNATVTVIPLDGSPSIPLTFANGFYTSAGPLPAGAYNVQVSGTTAGHTIGLNRLALETAINAQEGAAAGGVVIGVGAAEAGAIVTVTVSGNAASNGSPLTLTVTPNGGGTYILSHSQLSQFQDGAISFHAVQTDAAGNTSALSSYTIPLDRSAPAAPSLNAEASILSGISRDEVLAGFALHVSLGGTGAVAGDKVDALRNGNVIDSHVLAQQDIDAGTFDFTLKADPADLVGVDGAYAFSARITDQAGNTGANASALNLTLDTSAPAAPGVSLVNDNGSSPSDHVTNAGALVLTGVEAGALVEYSVNGGATWTSSFTAAEGADSVQVRQTDAAGNVGAASAAFAFTLDTHAPAQLGVTPLDVAVPFDKVAADGTLTLAMPALLSDGPLIGFQVLDAGVPVTSAAVTAVSLDGMQHVPMTFSGGFYLPNAALPGGAYTIQVSGLTAGDTVGVLRLAVETQLNAQQAASPVGVPIGLSPAEAGAAVAVTVLGTATDGSALTLPITPNAQGNYNLSAAQIAQFSDGTLTFHAVQTDAAGNSSTPSSFALQLDRQAPAAPGISVDANIQSGVSHDEILAGFALHVSLAGTGAKVGDRVDELLGGSVIDSHVLTQAEITAGTFDFTLQAQPSELGTTVVDGSYAFSASITDHAGNTSANAAARNLTIDTAAPAAPGIALATDSGASSSDHITNVGTLALTGVEAGALVEYSINGGATWTSSFTAAEGANSVQVRQTDAAGNVSAASTALAFTLDTHAPSGLGAVALNVAFAFTPSAPATTIDLSLPDLGNDTFLNFAINRNGTPWNGAQAAIIPSDGSPAIALIYQNGAYVPVSPLPAGPYTVEISNAVAGQAFVVIRTALDTGLNAQETSGTVNVGVGGALEAGATVTVTATGTALDGSPLTQTAAHQANGAYTLSAAQFALFRDGTLSFHAVQTDAAGNSSSLGSYTIPLDRVTPTAPVVSVDANILSGISHDEILAGFPLHVSLAGTGAVAGDRIDALNGAHVLDSHVLTAADLAAGTYAFTLQADPEDLATIVDGTYAFSARVVDHVGNVGANASALNLTLDTAAPTAPGVSLANDSGSSPSDHVTNAGALALTGVEAGALVEYSVNGGATWTSSFTAAEGANSVQVRQTDAAGNVSAASSAFAFTLDTHAPTQLSVTPLENLFKVSGAASTVTFSEPGVAASNLLLGFLLYDLTPSGAVPLTGATLVAVPLDGSPSIPLTFANGFYNASAPIPTGPFNVQVSGVAIPASHLLGLNPIVVEHTVGITEAALGISAGLPGPGIAPREAGATIAVTVSGTAVDGSALTLTPSLNNGQYTLTPAQIALFKDGTLTFSATQTDAAGNSSTPSSVQVLLDTHAPGAPTVSVDANILSGISRDEVLAGFAMHVSLAGTGAQVGDLLESLQGTNINDRHVLTQADISAGSYDFALQADPADLVNILDGTYAFSARVTDQAGNVGTGAAALSLTVDLTPPAVPVLALGTGVADGATAAEATAATGVVTVSGEVGADISVTFSNGANSIIKHVTGTGAAQAVTLASGDLVTLGDGTISVSASATDVAGNAQTAPASTASFVLDTSEPAVAITTIEGGDDLINAAEASGGIQVGGTAQIGSSLSVNGQAVAVDATGHWTASIAAPAADGQLIVRATATDGAGNSATATHNLTVDTTPPPMTSQLLAGTGIGAFAIGDVNGDGKLDIVGTSFSNGGYVLLGDGAGGFSLQSTFPIPTPQDPQLVDVNSDGKLDLIVSQTYSNSVGVFLGNGDGTFAAATSVPSGTVIPSVTVADVNLDGHPDLISTGYYNAAAFVSLANGNGTFAAPNAYPTGSVPADVAVADFNGDGKPDFVTADADGNTLTVYKGDGSGSFSHMTTLSSQSSLFLVTGDLGNGHQSIVATNRDADSVSVFVGDGTGSFVETTYSVGTTPFGVTLADVDGDGTLDIVVANAVSNSFSILHGDGNGQFEAAKNYSLGQSAATVGVADFNGDGIADIVTAQDGLSIYFHRVELDPSSNSGSLADALTNDATPSLSGTAEAGSTVALYDGNTLLGSTTANALTGGWSFTAPMLADGAHSLTATATDLAGNTSQASAALVVTIDTAAPATPGIASIGGADSVVTDQAGDNLISGTADPGSIVYLSYNGNVLELPGGGNTTADASGNWSYSLTAANLALIGEGTSKIVIATATDAAGNVSSASSFTFAVDTANHAPALTGTQANLTAGTENTPYTVSAASLLAGYTDVDGDSLSVTGLDAENGIVTDNGNGTFTITPVANYHGTINLNYGVSDSHGGITAATQSFVLAAVNHAPVLAALPAIQYGNDFNASYSVTNPSGIYHFSDGTFAFDGIRDDPAEGFAYLYRLDPNLPNGADGEIHLVSGGQFTLRSIDISDTPVYPTAGASFDIYGYSNGHLVAARTVSYAASAQHLTFDSSWANVDDIRFALNSSNPNQYLIIDNLRVDLPNPGLVVSELAATTGHVSLDGPSRQMTFADVDLSDTHAASAQIVSSSWSGGTLDAAHIASLESGLALTLADSTGTGSGTLTVQMRDAALDFLAAGQTLSLLYDITVTDSAGASSTQQITVTATGANDAPLLSGAQANLAAGNEGAAYTVTAADLLAGFIDPDGDTISVTGLTADHGSVVDNGNGTFTISPAANFNGLVSLSYTVTDGKGGSTSAAESFTLTAAAPVVTVEAATPTSTEGSDLVFTFHRTGDLSQPMLIDFGFLGNANNGGLEGGPNADYTYDGAPQFAAGSDTFDLHLHLIADGVTEGPETTGVYLAENYGYTVGTPGSATATIYDPPVVTVEAATPTGTEGGDLVFTFHRTGDLSQPMLIDFGFLGNANNGGLEGGPNADYTYDGAPQFAAGSATYDLHLHLIADGVTEGPETTGVYLAQNYGYTVGTPGSATATIYDPPVVTVEAATPTGTEGGDLVFTFHRTGDLSQPMLIDFGFLGNANNGGLEGGPNADYTYDGAPQFAAGADTYDLHLHLIADGVTEGSETTGVYLAQNYGYTVGTPGTATATIYDPPSTPVIASVGGDDDVVSGQVNDALVTGTADPGSVVTLSYNGTVLQLAGGGSTTADASGNWSYSLTAANLSLIGEGNAKAISAAATDAGGYVSTPSTAFSFAVDTVAPSAVGIITALSADTGSSSSDFITTVAAQTAAGIYTGVLDPGEKIQVSADGTTWLDAIAGLGIFTASSVALSPGTNTLSVRTIDAAGNVTAGYGQSYTLDLVPPGPPSVALDTDSGASSADRITNVDTISLSDVEVGASVGYSTDGGTSWTDTFSAVEGANSVQVRQADVAGNLGPASAAFTFTLDTVAPSAPVLALGTGVSGGATAAEATAASGVVTVSGELGASIAVTFSNGANSITKSVIGTGAAQAVTLGAADLATLSDGTISVSAVATDVAGNTSNPGATSLTLDTIAPVVPLLALGAGVANGATSAEAIAAGGVVTVSGESGASIATTFTNGLQSVTKTVIGTGAPQAVRLAAADLVTLGDGAISVSAVATDTAGNSSSAGSSSFTLDTRAPTVLSETITGATGIQNSRLNAGDVLSVTVTMNEAVNVTGTPRLQLQIGGASVQANYVSGSGSDHLVFAYTILAGQADANGISLGANALTLNGGTITDLAGNAAVLTAALVTDNPGYIVDTTAPVAPALALGVGVANGATTAEATAASGIVTVSGESGADIAVTFGNGANSVVQHVTGTGAAQAVTLATADLATLGDGTISVRAVATDLAGNASNAGTTSFRLDTVAPAAPVFALGAGVANGATSAEATATGGVVTVTGEAGASIVATFTNGVQSVTKTVTGTGAAQAVRLAAADLTTLGDGMISVSAVATDVAGNISAAGSTSFTLDTRAPTLLSETITGATGIQNSTLNAGDVVSVTVAMSEVVNVAGTPRLQLQIGNASVQANYISGSGSDHLVFAYTVLAGQTDANGISLKANALTLNGGTITDLAGNAAVLTAALVADNPGYLVDTTAPVAPGFALGAGVANGATAAEAAAASGVVTVSGESGADIAVTFGNGANRIVQHVTGTGAAQAVTLTAANLTMLGDGTISVSAVATDLAGNVSNAGTTTFRLDTVAPTAPVLALGAGVANGATSAEATATGGVVIVSGESGASIAATFTNGLQSVTKTVTGTGAAQAVRLAAADLATLGDGTISVSAVATDGAGNSSAASSTSFTLDTHAPTVLGETITGATGIQNSTLNAGDIVNLTVAMSEAVTVTGTPRLQLHIGSTNVQANYVSGSGSDHLVFAYTILAGQADANGISLGANALTLNGGTITDLAGNAAALAAVLVADNPGYIVDTTAPVAKTEVIRYQSDGFVLPEWALLANDTDVSSLHIAGYSAITGLSIAQNSNSITITDSPTNGGSFSYTVADLAGNATASAADSVSQQTGSMTAASGTDTILVDDNGGHTLTGNSGNDVLLGYGGNDVLIGGGGIDFLVGGTGLDTMTGGAGADTFMFAPGDTGTPTSTNFDTITDFTTNLDIFAYASDLSIVSDARAATAGLAHINANGIATFAAGDTTLSARIAATEAAINANGTAHPGQVAAFQFGSDAYVFVSDGVDGVSANDVLVKLNGINTGSNSYDQLLLNHNSFIFA